MKKITGIVVLLFLVVVLVASMAATAVAAKPTKIDASAKDPYYYANDPGWVKTGTWKVEQYTKLPPPLTGPNDLLVANDAGATASLAVDLQGSLKYIEVWSAKYWQCGTMEIFLDGASQGTFSLNITPVGAAPQWSQLIWTSTKQGGTTHTVTIKALGTGGPPLYPAFHFVNVQYVRTY
jgi:hypothetical protein